MNTLENLGIQPVITSALNVSAKLGQDFSYTITADNGPVTYEVGLPTWLELNAQTAVLSGRPSVCGVVEVLIVAVNGDKRGSAVLKISVTTDHPEITSELSLDCYKGIAFDYQIKANNAPTDFTVTGLPQGLDYNPAGGGIFGMPEMVGDYTVTVEAKNGGSVAQATLIIHVMLAVPVFEELEPAEARYQQEFFYSVPVKGMVLSYTANGLPEGLELDQENGLIHGTPQVMGPFPIRIEATNEYGTGSVEFLLLVRSPNYPRPYLEGMPEWLQAKTNNDFSFKISACDATSYVVEGLHNGLSVDVQSGLISGKSAEAGCRVIKIKAVNAAGSDEKTVMLVVVPDSRDSTPALGSTVLVANSYPYPNYEAWWATVAKDSADPQVENSTYYGMRAGRQGNNGAFMPMPTAINEQQAPGFESLAGGGGFYTFSRKYGSTLIYQEISTVMKLSNDRVLGSKYSSEHRFARLISVTDRKGNCLTYDYASRDSLVPMRIRSVGARGAILSIQQDSKGLITDIWDANNNHTKYVYESRDYGSPTHNVNLLKQVIAPDGKVTKYDYNLTWDDDQRPRESWNPKTTYWHAELSQIEDANQNLYSMNYVFDRSKRDYMGDQDVYIGYYTKCGIPRNVQSVTLPWGGQSSFANNSLIWIEDNKGVKIFRGSRSNLVTDVMGMARTYDFTNVEIFPVPLLQERTGNNITGCDMICYQSMIVTHGNIGREQFDFDPGAGMALSRVVDLCNNVTTYEHLDAWNSAGENIIVLEPGLSLGPVGFYNDPTAEIRELKQ